MLHTYEYVLVRNVEYIILITGGGQLQHFPPSLLVLLSIYLCAMHSCKVMLSSREAAKPLTGISIGLYFLEHSVKTSNFFFLVKLQSYLGRFKHVRPTWFVHNRGTHGERKKNNSFLLPTDRARHRLSMCHVSQTPSYQQAGGGQWQIWKRTSDVTHSGSCLFLHDAKAWEQREGISATVSFS